MGLFSRNESANLYQQYDIIADESYTYPTGFGRILAESAENDMNMFKALIARDFEEAAYIQEGYGGFAPEVIQEGVGDIFGKIKELLLKLVAKIKGIFKSFMAKFNSVVIKDNKEYFNKYKNDVYGGNVKWDGFKAKFSKAKKNIEAGTTYAGGDKFLDITRKYYPYNFDKEKFEDDWLEDNQALIEFLNTTGISISEPGDFKKEFHELYFEDEEEIDDSDLSSAKSRVEAVMSQGDRFGKTLKKTLDDLDKEVKKLVKRFEKMRDDAVKDIGNTDKKTKKDTYKFVNSTYKPKVDDKGNTSYEKELEDKEVNYSGNKEVNRTLADKNAAYSSSMYTLATIYQNATTTVHNAVLDEIKFEAKNCRSLYAAMVAHALRGKNKVVADNSSALIVMAQEAAEYEFESDFELA